VVRIAVVMTCFNRRDKTLACLGSLAGQRDHGADITAYVVDDGSTDGTAEAVAREHPEAILLLGTGALYWGGGMRMALEHAFTADYDYYLWLNDDIDLDDDAVTRLLSTARELEQRGEHSAIVIGSMRDPVSGAVTYGGRYRPFRSLRTRFVVMQPAAEDPVPSETLNGNLVLVPGALAHAVGNIDASFRQKWGDQDYGLRARAAGGTVWVAPSTFGTCARNPDIVYGRQPLRTELRTLTSIKQFPPRDWAAFTRRWAGPLWPMFWASPYMHAALRMTREHARKAIRSA